MSYRVLDCLLPYIQDSEDRASISLVCTTWNELVRSTRRKITIEFCYSCTPQRLFDRFPNTETLRIEGKPMFVFVHRLPDTWGGFCFPWVQHLNRLKHLVSIEFKRMVVRNDDLEIISAVMSKRLLCLKLPDCSGFSTLGLCFIAENCTNLRTLSLPYSTVDEIDGEWLHQLAEKNKVLENLDFFMVPFEHIKMEDLEHIARDCPLVSVKVGFIPYHQFRNFFAIANRLREFCGGDYSLRVNHPVVGFDLHPPVGRVTSLAPVSLDYYLMSTIAGNNARFLMKLDLLEDYPVRMNYCDLLKNCHDLRELKVTEVIGDEGLHSIALTCRKLKRLHIRPAECLGITVPFHVVKDDGLIRGITTKGIMDLAKNCRDLECLKVHLVEIGNRALEDIGQFLRKLKHFHLSLCDCADCSQRMSKFPLDRGVGALLQGCQNIRRLGLQLRPGGLSDTGFGYIGLLGQRLRSLILCHVGGTDAGLLDLSTGCPSLQMLDLCRCNFTLQAISTAVRQLTSLSYISVAGHVVNPITDDFYFREMSRPFWNIEQIVWPPSFFLADGKFLAYHTIAGQREDTPDFVFAFDP